MGCWQCPARTSALLSRDDCFSHTCDVRTGNRARSTNTLIRAWPRSTRFSKASIRTIASTHKARRRCPVAASSAANSTRTSSVNLLGKMGCLCLPSRRRGRLCPWALTSRSAPARIGRNQASRFLQRHLDALRVAPLVLWVGAQTSAMDCSMLLYDSQSTLVEAASAPAY